MTDKTFGLDRDEEELLISGISDEALEIAAGTANQNSAPPSEWFSIQMRPC